MNAQPKRAPVARIPTKSRVLVVDDDVSILGVVAEVLEDDGYEVTTAATAEEAIEILDGPEFALVMSDIRLPGMNGVALLEQIKKERPRTHVIMITSHASLETSIDAIKHGAYDYLQKPFEDLSLISTAARRAIEAYELEIDRSQLIRSLKLSNKELARLNGVLHGLAIRDGLTDLFNHRYINEVLDKEIERATVEETDLSVIFVDVDKFKVFNDRHGHQNGDVILREISALMRENVRKKDIVARWGGEEFVIVSPDTNNQTAARLAESLRALIAEHVFMGNSSNGVARITFSAGVASLRTKKTKTALIEAADNALYEAKKRGRNQVCVAR